MFVTKRLLPFALAAGLALPSPATARAATVVIEPSRDNTLFEPLPDQEPTSNGAGIYLFAGRVASSRALVLRRALLAFDVAAAVPAGATLAAVTLELRVSRTEQAGLEPFALHRMLRDWGEGESDSTGLMGGGGGAPAQPGDATWEHRFFDTDPWTMPGADGDYAAAPSATAMVDDVGPYLWGSTPELVDDVQGWLDEPEGAFGWILIGDESFSAIPSAKRFDSREGASPPRLVVTYTPEAPGGAGAACVLLVLRALRRARRTRSQRGGQRPGRVRRRRSPPGTGRGSRAPAS